MELKIEFNIDVVSSKDIVLPFKIIKSGEVFKLKDAYKEGSFLVIGVDTGKGVHEALFKLNNPNVVVTKERLKNNIESFIAPYMKNASYNFIKTKN